ncbi:hypothetical protein PoB_003070900 [Plakobranchus ocellatus]|uniref:Uncharacterized protein n=1 Tax=Plakobranchus ocellatus TaxID=259542 RepID=A0AAV4A967_9GAST|nr:hypothetical protein PoB_003070900 [Plakobranchus ocellatus]
MVRAGKFGEAMNLQNVRRRKMVYEDSLHNRHRNISDDDMRVPRLPNVPILRAFQCPSIANELARDVPCPLGCQRKLPPCFIGYVKIKCCLSLWSELPMTLRLDLLNLRPNEGQVILRGGIVAPGPPCPDQFQVSQPGQTT